MIQQNENRLLKAALEYHKLGWSIIPIGADEKPPFKWALYKKRKATERELQEWFGNGKYKSLAVVCGSVSRNLCVMNLDSEDRCDWWKLHHSENTNKFPTVKTKSGQNIYFRVSQTFQNQCYDKIYLICEDGYSILPPSPDKEWLRPPNDIISFLLPCRLGLEQFDIKRPEVPFQFTDETEDIDEIDESDDNKELEEYEEKRRNRSNANTSKIFLSKNIISEVEKAIENTLPKEQEELSSAIFNLCRWLKAIPELKDLPAKDLNQIVQDWHKRAFPSFGRKGFMRTSMYFIHAWMRVKYPKGEILLERAKQRALKDKLNPPDAMEYEDFPKAQLLLRVCYQLQIEMGEQPFFLSYRKAGEIVGLSHTEAGMCLEKFVEDEKLKIEKKYTRKKANRYRYIINKLH